jgi:hypothetical protein
MSTPTEYDLRVDAFGRQWLEAHPEALAFEMQYRPGLEVLPREDELITLYDDFESGGGCPTCDMGPTFEVGITVPVNDGRYLRIAIQYGNDSIDVGAVVRAVLAVTNWE